MRETAGFLTVSELVVNAIAVYEHLINESKDGGEIVIRKGEKEKEVLLAR